MELSKTRSLFTFLLFTNFLTSLFFVAGPCEEGLSFFSGT